MNDQEWALDPWSAVPKWIAVPRRCASYMIPKPDDRSPALWTDRKVPRFVQIPASRVDRHRYVSPFVGEVAVFGAPSVVAPLLRQAEIAIVLMVAIKQLCPVVA